MLEFKNAIVRKPCKAMIEGISTGMFSEEAPIYEDSLKQHEQYVKTLEELGLDVLVLEALEEYPDSCFVEDPAVVMKECAIVTNSPRESRNGEKHEIIEPLKKFYNDDQIFYIEAPGTMEVTEGLHLKDFAIYLENNNMLVSEKMNEVEDFQKFNRYVVEKDELYAINSLYINGTVMVPKGFPKTLEYIKSLGYPVKVVDTDEFKKIDGSLTCLSLRF